MQNYQQIQPFNEFKILSAYEKIKQILQGKLPYPTTAEFYISNRCNHNCLGCHSKDFLRLKSPFMEIGLFKNCVEQLSKVGLEGIDFSGGGEPLLHPDFNEMIEFTNKKGIKSGLITNGIFLKGKSNKRFIENLSFARIAFDASTGKTYKMIHGYDDYSVLIKNIKDLIKQKYRYNSSITIGLKFLISRINYGQILPAAQFARNLGADYIQFKPIMNTKRFDIQNPLIINKIEESFELARRLSTKEFSVVTSLEKTKTKTKCVLSPLHPAIDTLGNVYVCNFFHYRKKTHSIGDLNKNSFNEIWLSKRHKNAIKNIRNRECNLCDCNFKKYMGIINEAIVKNRAHLEFI